MLYGTASLLICCQSCSDDNSEPLPAIGEKTYSSSTLDLNYCGEAMPGKAATLIPGAEGQGNNATIHLFGSLDLSLLGIDGISGTIPTCGVLPGAVSTDLDVSLNPGDGCYTFSGSGRSDYCTYDYSGNIASDRLTVSFSDVLLADQSLAGTVLAPAPLSGSLLTGYDSSPIYVDWQIDPSMGLDINLSDILSAVATMPLIPVYNGTAYMSVAQALVSTLQTVALLPNGNIVLRYYSSTEGSTQLYTSVGNTLQYIPAKPGSMLIYPNPMAIYARWLVLQSGNHNVTEGDFRTAPLSPVLASTGLSSLTDQEKAALKAALLPVLLDVAKEFLPMLSTGLPLCYMPTATGMNIFIDTPVAIGILQKVAQGVMSSPDALAILKKLLLSYPALQESASILDQLLQQLPDILQRTTTFRIGLSFTKMDV